MTRRDCVSFLLVVLALLGIACTETKTPTEPAVFAPTPTPTPVTGEPASLSGKVWSYGPLEPGTTVECQGQKTTTATDGTYSLPSLRSGFAQVTVTYSYVYKGAVVTDYMNPYVLLKPGPNTIDFLAF